MKPTEKQKLFIWYIDVKDNSLFIKTQLKQNFVKPY